MNVVKSDKINAVKDILKANIGNRFVTVDFVKKSTGKLRRITIGRNKALEASVKGVPSEATLARRATLSANGMLVVEEVTPDHRAQWRTIPLANVKRIKAGGVETIFE